MFEIEFRIVQRNESLTFYVVSINLGGQIPIRSVSPEPYLAFGELIYLLECLVEEYERLGYLSPDTERAPAPTDATGNAPALTDAHTPESEKTPVLH